MSSNYLKDIADDWQERLPFILPKYKIISVFRNAGIVMIIAVYYLELAIVYGYFR